MRYHFTVPVLLTIFIIGCSSGGGILTPVNDNSQNSSSIEFSNLPVFVSDRQSDASPSQGAGLMGLFNLSIDNGKAALTPVRRTSSMDVLEVVDITNFLSIAPCNDCVQLKGASITPDNHISLTIGIKHPFPAGDPYAPITGRNRADLHVFNVEGIIISDTSAVSYSTIGQSIADFKLLSADGYTGYLDTALDTIFPTDATIHPYVLHFDDYSTGNYNPSNPTGFQSVTDPPPSGNLVMAMGCDYNYQDYIFDLGITESMNFIFAVGCTYAVSADSKNLRFSPEYRVPQHNKKAASEVSIVVVNNELEEGKTSSSAEIEIHVVDISHDIAVGTALNEMRVDSSVDEIAIELPGLISGTLTIDGASPVSGTGHSSSDPLVYTVTITNSLNAIEGIYPGLIKVKDTYSPTLNELPLLNGKDGIKRVDPIQNPLEGLIDIASFETYQILELEVVPPQTTIYVDNSYTGTVFEGTMSAPFITINDGITAALDGYTVKVDDSTTPYNEQVAMKSNVIVLSENWDTSDGTDRAFIDGPEVADAHSVAFTDVSNAVLSGFQIGYAGVQALTNRMIHVTGGSDNTIINCYFTGNTILRGIRCIDVTGTITVPVNNLTIENCEISYMDSTTAELRYFFGVYADYTTGMKIKNNKIHHIRSTTDTQMKNIYGFMIRNSNNVTITNNLISHIVPHTGGAMSIFFYGCYFYICDGVIIKNNTVDDIIVNDAFSIQQAFAYYFHGSTAAPIVPPCQNVTFSNNIITHIHADGSFPPGLARGVVAALFTLTCDYTDIFDVASPYFNSPPSVSQPGVGCLAVDPLYIDAANNNYDLQATSPAQAGDISFLDWDDDNSGGYESRSRMGCHGGPGGETVGLLN